MSNLKEEFFRRTSKDFQQGFKFGFDAAKQAMFAKLNVELPRILKHNDHMEVNRVVSSVMDFEVIEGADDGT